MHNIHEVIHIYKYVNMCVCMYTFVAYTIAYTTLILCGLLSFKLALSHCFIYILPLSKLIAECIFLGDSNMLHHTVIHMTTYFFVVSKKYIFFSNSATHS